MTKLVDEDTMRVVPNDEKGGLGVAIEKLAALLGCEDETLTAGVRETLAFVAEPAKLGWLALSDAEGTISILKDGEEVAVVRWVGRGSWKAAAAATDGRAWRCEGANDAPECEEWQEA